MLQIITLALAASAAAAPTITDDTNSPLAKRQWPFPVPKPTCPVDSPEYKKCYPPIMADCLVTPPVSNRFCPFGNSDDATCYAYCERFSDYWCSRWC